MIKQKILPFILLIIFLSFSIHLGCSSTDPMDIPMNAKSLEEYGKSMNKISKAFKDTYERDRFLSALEHIALGPKQMISCSLGGVDYERLREIKEYIKIFDGKTAREIIEVSETLDNIPVEELEETYGEDPDIEVIVGEMLCPEKKLARLREEHRKIMITISNSLSQLNGLKERWIRVYHLEPDSIPTKDVIIEVNGGPLCWPNPNYPPGAEYIYTEDGEAACIYEGEIITRSNLGEYWDYKE